MVYCNSPQTLWWSPKNKVLVSSPAFHVSRAVLLPLPPQNDTVSWPVKAWNIGNAIHRSGLKALVISWAAIKRKHFPVPKAIHTSALLRRWDDVTANTTASVSTVRMETFVFPSSCLLLHVCMEQALTNPRIDCKIPQCDMCWLSAFCSRWMLLQ